MLAQQQARHQALRSIEETERLSRIVRTARSAGGRASSVVNATRTAASAVADNYAGTPSHFEHLRGRVKMIRKALIGFVAIVWFSAVQAQPAPESSGADLIVFNAKIFTGNRAQPEATALAVKDGRIYSVGPDEAILALKNPSTRVIDAHSRRVAWHGCLSTSSMTWPSTTMSAGMVFRRCARL